MTAPLLIWGAGAIGGTIGAHLARAGEDVLLVDTEAAHVAAMTADGLAIEGPLAEFRVPVAAVTPDALTGTYDRVLLCVKAHHTAAATAALLPHLAPQGYVASFQNGLCEDIIAARTGADRVIGAFINFGADYLAPGRILYGGRGACVLGELDGSLTPRLLALHRLLRVFEPEAITTHDITAYLWGKLGYGALLFVTALTDDSIADVLGDAAAQPLLTAVAREVMAVAAALGIRPRGFNGFDPAAFAPGATDAAALAASFAAMTAHNRRSAKTHSGIWRDLAVRRRPTEVDPQVGLVVAQAKALGLAAPLLARLVAMIHEIERGERRLDRGNLRDLAG